MKNTHPSILILGNSPVFKKRILDYLDDTYHITSTKTVKETLKVLKKPVQPIGVILIDLTSLLDENPETVLTDIKKAASSEVIFFHKSSIDIKTDIPTMINLIKMGAYDILILPDFKELLEWVVEKAMEFFLMQEKLKTHPNDSLPKQIHPESLNITHPFNCKEVTILIADDEPSFRSTIDMMLEPYGYTLIEASSGEEVLQKASQHNIDIVLLDVSLGDMTGDELVLTLKKQNPAIEIIMVTAYKDIELIVNTIKDGAFDYVVKGRQQNLIPQKINQALHKKYFHSITTTPQTHT